MDVLKDRLIEIARVLDPYPLSIEVTTNDRDGNAIPGAKNFPSGLKISMSR